MASELGRRIRDQRQILGIGVREFARRINKSPAFITNLELDDNPPSASEETLREIAKQLTLDPYEIITLAGKTPQEVAPEDALDAALYRKVKALSRGDKEALLGRLPEPIAPSEISLPHPRRD
jgi:transcriptional regulator with XRE-family HTH domain